MAPSIGSTTVQCVFCEIIEDDREGVIFKQSENLMVLKDIRPASKFHFLIISKKHISDAKCLKPENKNLVQEMIEMAHKLLEENGFTNKNDTRMGFHWPPFHSISHLHLHVIAPTDQMTFLSKFIFRQGWWFVTPEYVLERISKM